MGDQVDMTIVHVVIYENDELDGIMCCPHIYWAPILECTSYRGIDCHMAFPKSFLVDFPAKQCSQIGKVILAI